MSRLSVPISARDHAQGPVEAPFTLVEYGDFQCPSCGEAYEIVKKVQKHFGDKLRFVYREYPLPMHPMAEPAAEAAEFAASKDKFWPMHDGLYEGQTELSEDFFVQLADKLKLDGKALTKSLDAGEFGDRVNEDIESGDDSDVTGTPTFFINGEQHDGSYDERTLIRAIEKALNA